MLTSKGRSIVCLAVIILFILLLCLLCSSCRSQQVVMQRDSVETHIQHDSVYLYKHDSIYIHQYLAGDTVYITRDRWHTVDKAQQKEIHDTIYQNIERVIEHPPRKYVPAFYKWCVAILIIIFILSIVRFMIRFIK
ncbi:MAG: hypothetical protein MJZ82_05730 [Paludibacteraceae bacterium]|nr:hypothetical protein [Paludibacteraceae bacterium]